MTRLGHSKTDLPRCGVIFDLDQKTQRSKEIESIIAKPAFWDDQALCKKILQERTHLNNFLTTLDNISSLIDDVELFHSMAVEDDDTEAFKELPLALKNLEKKIGDMEFSEMLSGPNDDKDAIVSINAGAGGREAKDWVEILLRMYLKWADNKGLKARVIDHLPGDEAGIKNVTFTVSGNYSYGYLKSETGVHRLIRLSPFDTNKRRHTSFASVSVLPSIDDDIEININPDDLRIDVYRSSGAGGQHVNKTSSAIRITHLPTGIVAQCQNERSQHRNKEMAFKVLKARLYEIESEKKRLEQQKNHDDMDNIAWGNQIRSYVLQPYQLIKDHRTLAETGNVDAVLNGDIDMFINAYLLTSEK